MRAKSYRIVLLLVMILVIIAAFAAIQSQQFPIRQSDGNARTAAVYPYQLKEYEGKIGIYRTGEDKPYRVIDVYVSTLPAADQIELRDGIYIQSDEHLQRIIEDYES